MPEQSSQPSSALQQIHTIAAARWRIWDERRRRGKGAPSAGSPGGVTGYERLGRQRRLPLTPGERRRALRMRRTGKTLREISQALNCSVSTIRRLLNDQQTKSTSTARGDQAAARQQATNTDLRRLQDRLARLESFLSALAQAFQELDGSRPPRRRQRTI